MGGAACHRSRLLSHLLLLLHQQRCGCSSKNGVVAKGVWWAGCRCRHDSHIGNLPNTMGGADGGWCRVAQEPTEQPLPPGPLKGPRHSPTVGSYGEAFSFEQGTPVSGSIRATQFGEPGLFPAPKLMGLYRTPSMSTLEESVNGSEAELDHARVAPETTVR